MIYNVLNKIHIRNLIILLKKISHTILSRVLLIIIIKTISIGIVKITSLTTNIIFELIFKLIFKFIIFKNSIFNKISLIKTLLINLLSRRNSFNNFITIIINIIKASIKIIVCFLNNNRTLITAGRTAHFFKKNFLASALGFQPSLENFI